jgi:hypothetical protein
MGARFVSSKDDTTLHSAFVAVAGVQRIAIAYREKVLTIIVKNDSAVVVE